MKKKFYSMTTLFSLLILLVFTASVSATENPTIVNGHVYADDAITPVSGIEVTVTCHDDGGDNVLTDETNGEGYYVVEFAPGLCSMGSTVDVEAAGVTTSATVENNIVIKNILYANLIIPEFSILAAGVTFVGAGLAYLFIRRNK